MGETMKSSVMDRREQRRLDTRGRLLDAAEQVFSEKGYEESTVLDITDAADVSKRTFYLHFTDKELVIEALAMKRFEELRDSIIAEKDYISKTSGPMREHMFWLAQMIFQFVADNPELMRIIFGLGGSFRLQALSREFMARSYEESMERECDFMPDAVVPRPVLAHAIAGMLHQLMCWWFQNPNNYSPADMAKMYTSVLFDSVEINYTKKCNEEE